jgi:hypothetical protein
MAYTKFHAAWADDPDTSTPITAEALDHIEQGISDAADAADAGGDITTSPPVTPMRAATPTP